MWDDGSVIASGYDYSSHWIFTTLYTPEDDWHPVNGHREFGFAENGDGTVTFYTQGVDRLSHTWYETVQFWTQIPFGSADALWSSLQSLIAEDSGSIVETATIKYRPDYEAVSDVLNGEATPSTLGCD